MAYSESFFYDGQIRRYISQFIRLVSDYYVEFGKDANGITALQRVPVLYGDPSRQVAQIIKGNSANTLPAVPAMAVYISGLAYDRERLQDPTLIQKVNIRERQFDPVTGTYTHAQGDAFTVERMMPAPFKLTLKLDIWTSNTEQKLQLIEQLTPMFSPGLEIQSTDNYLDWTSLSIAYLSDTNWDSRTVPTGADEPISIATLTFELPIFISTSVKVKRLGVIQTIINNLQELPDLNSLGLVLVTVLNYGILLETSNTGSTMRLVKPGEISNGELIANLNHAWAPLLEQYGAFKPGSSQIRLPQENGSEIVGTIALHPTDPTILLYTPFLDTLPANTLAPINAIINPQNVTVNSSILTPTIGTRFLLTNDIGSPDNAEGALAWKGSDGADLIAATGDIIQYNGTSWSVSFDSTGADMLQYVTNLTTGVQYKWSNSQWTMSYDGVYLGGQWGLAI